LYVQQDKRAILDSVSRASLVLRDSLGLRDLQEIPDKRDRPVHLEVLDLLASLVRFYCLLSVYCRFIFIHFVIL